MAKRLSRLIVASSETSADLLYATGFRVGDDIIFLEQNGRKTILLSDLEIDRGRREAKVDEIVSLSAFNQKLAAGGPDPTFPETVAGFLKSHRVRKAVVPEEFPLGLAQKLAAAGVDLVVQEGFFFPEREFKTAAEIKLIRQAIKITEAGLARAYEVLRAADPGPAGYLRWAGARLTSEILRAEIESAILRAGGTPNGAIVAGGDQACDPHERGRGPLKANSLIVLDVFPRDATSGYFGDVTRTVVRGQASAAQRKLWNTVLEGQKLALRKMKPGVHGGPLHDEIKAFFTGEGFPTEIRDGLQCGFFHGTGHCFGLEIHESPRFSKAIFKPGQVITVEPGLYYPGLGGVRIEDDVLITEKGIQILSTIDKPLEL